MTAISCRNRQSGKETRREVRHLFSFIGAEPNTDWLQHSGIKLDASGFVLVGGEACENRLPLETSRRGIFAVGDVRSTSVKRVAASVGDGAQVVASIHTYLELGREQALIVGAAGRARRLSLFAAHRCCR